MEFPIKCCLRARVRRLPGDTSGNPNLRFAKLPFSLATRSLLRFTAHSSAGMAWRRTGTAPDFKRRAQIRASWQDKIRLSEIVSPGAKTVPRDSPLAPAPLKKQGPGRNRCLSGRRIRCGLASLRAWLRKSEQTHRSYRDYSNLGVGHVAGLRKRCRVGRRWKDVKTSVEFSPGSLVAQNADATTLTCSPPKSKTRSLCPTVEWKSPL
jgi:hypothetical protein